MYALSPALASLAARTWFSFGQLAQPDCGSTILNVLACTKTSLRRERTCLINFAYSFGMVIVLTSHAFVAGFRRVEWCSTESPRWGGPFYGRWFDSLKGSVRNYAIALHQCFMRLETCSVRWVSKWITD